MDRMQLFLLLSFVSWFSAEAMFGYYSGVLIIDPYPSIADIFYLAGYIFFILLLWRLNKTYKIELSILFSLIVTFFLFAFYVLYISVFIFDVYSLSADSADLILVFVYPIFDLFVIISCVLYYFREREISLNKEYISWLLISACGFSFFLADVIFGFNDLFGYTQDDHLFDLFFNMGYLLLGIAILTRIYYLNIHSRNDWLINDMIPNVFKSKIKSLKVLEGKKLLGVKIPKREIASILIMISEWNHMSLNHHDITPSECDSDNCIFMQDWWYPKCYLLFHILEVSHNLAIIQMLFMISVLDFITYIFIRGF